MIAGHLHRQNVELPFYVLQHLLRVRNGLGRSAVRGVQHRRWLPEVRQPVVERTECLGVLPMAMPKSIQLKDQSHDQANLRDNRDGNTDSPQLATTGKVGPSEERTTAHQCHEAKTQGCPRQNKNASLCRGNAARRRGQW